MEKDWPKCLQNFPDEFLLQARKPLLAFSGGVDSTSLFFILLEKKVKFDIAFVNYGMRCEADEEERYALDLARKYGAKAHIAKAPMFEKNFEAEARRFRYSFFESLVEKYGYDVLMTAHQLNDRLEWMMMRLVRGAGVAGLSGMREKDLRRTGSMKRYFLVRPLLNCTKNELLHYLHKRKLKYFIDASNRDPRYERNYSRKWFCDQMTQKYSDGLRRSFSYLQSERKMLDSLFEVVWSEKKLRVIRLKHPEAAATAAGTILKELGHLPTSHERELFGRVGSMTAGRKWAVERVENYQYITPYLSGIVMGKSFRERCR